MTRQLEAMREERQTRKDAALVEAVEFGLFQSVARAGGVLEGLGVSFRGGDCLITVKADVSGRPQIAFVGAADFAECLLKVVREARGDRLRWREDRYASK